MSRLYFCRWDGTTGSCGHQDLFFRQKDKKDRLLGVKGVRELKGVKTILKAAGRAIGEWGVKKKRGIATTALAFGDSC